MKKTFLLLVLLSILRIAYSQTASWNYNVTTQASSPISMTGSSVLGAGGDDLGYSLNWPFSFQIYDDIYTSSNQLSMNSNGYIKFNSLLSLSARNSIIPSNNSLYGEFLSYGGNTDGSISSNVSYIVTGTAPNRILTIAFTYYTYYTMASSVLHADVQISFYEATNNIKIDYSNVGGTNFVANYIGINAGDAVYGTNIGTFPTSSVSYVFSPSSVSISPVQAFNASNTNYFQNQLSWTKNTNNNDVLIAYNTLNTFDTLTNGVNYNVGNQISAGQGTILYKGSLNSFAHTSLIADTTYYYKIWSHNSGNNYSAALTDSVHTPALVAPVVNITATGSTIFCQGDSVILVSNTGINYGYQWYKNGQSIVNANQSNYSAKGSGNYSVMITDTLSQLFTLSQSILVVANSSNFNVNIFSSNLNLIHPNTTTTIINQTPNQSNYYFVWDLGDGNIFNGDSLPNNSYTYSSNGFFDVSLTAIDTLTGCIDSVLKPNYISVAGIPVPCNPFVPSISPTGYMLTMCPGDSIVLTANGNSNFSYQWLKNGAPTNDTLDSLVVFNNGTYSVIMNYLLDACPPKQSFPKALNYFSTNKPQVYNDSNFTSCTNDSLRFFVPSPNNYYSYLWSNNETGIQSYYTNSNDVFVKTIDNNGCKSNSDTIWFDANRVPITPICLVSVDSTSNHNIVSWQPPLINNVDSFIIYRETTNNVFIPIGAVSSLNLPVYHDNQANPKVQSYRYKLQTKDSCGNYSLLSPLHKSIHLQIGPGIGSSYNLIWTSYVGATINTYYIYRGTDSLNLLLLDSIAGTNNSYTDPNAPSGNVYYSIIAKLQSPCNNSKANTNYNTSRSNRANNIISGFDKNIQKQLKIIVVPNPSSGIFQIKFDNQINQNTSFSVINSLGEVIIGENIFKNKSLMIDLSKHSQGVYFFVIQNNNGVFVKKLIVQ